MELPFNLIGEDRQFENLPSGRSELYISPEPQSLWYFEKKNYSQDDLENVKKCVYNRAKFRCELCNISIGIIADARIIYRYEYNYASSGKHSCRTLKRILLACADCDDTTNYFKTKNYSQLIKIGKTPIEVHLHITDVLSDFRIKNQIVWITNEGVLEKNGIKRMCVSPEM